MTLFLSLRQLSSFPCLRARVEVTCHIFEALGCHKFEFMRTVNEYGPGIVNAQAPHTARNTPGVGVWFTLLPRVSPPPTLEKVSWDA